MCDSINIFLYESIKNNISYQGIPPNQIIWRKMESEVGYNSLFFQFHYVCNLHTKPPLWIILLPSEITAGRKKKKMETDGKTIYIHQKKMAMNLCNRLAHNPPGSWWAEKYTGLDCFGNDQHEENLESRRP